ncbi:MAG TPA: DUF4276 family protein [Kofleriaceae bacterium]|nr:DUF4276 family protein [Kofleriaceae bacterium]
MKRLLILVEGLTEKRVVGAILRDHLRARGVDTIPTILDTKPPNVGPRFKGGVSTWSKIQDHLKRLLGDTAAVGVTTMIDYYGLPNDVPGMGTRPNGPPRTRVEHVEQAIGAQFNDRRFRPYLMLHELEAMLFTDISKWEHRFDAAAIAALKHDVHRLLPEAINETREGAPSRRIKSRLQDYSKGIHGPLAAQDIGLAAIRAACPHFAAWLTWMESFGEREDGDPIGGNGGHEPPD